MIWLPLLSFSCSVFNAAAEAERNDNRLHNVPALKYFLPTPNTHFPSRIALRVHRKSTWAMRGRGHQTTPLTPKKTFN